ncbi:MAG: ribonuclease VapC48 [Candidatus Xenobia bacterium]
MSYSVDANLLIYASDTSCSHHIKAQEFLRGAAESNELLFLAYPTIMAFLRISTHPGVFKSPLTPARAQSIGELTALPQIRIIGEEPGFLDVFREVTESLSVRGNAVHDAHLASILRQHGVRVLYTNDRDFRRFEFLTVRNPLE